MPNYSTRFIEGAAAAFALFVMVIGCSTAAATVDPQQLLSVLKWRSVGPYTGGRVTSVAGVAAHPNVFYAAYADGGLWRTTSYGNEWKNISGSAFGTDAVGAVAVAPSNPEIIYVGTGDPAPRNTVMTSGEGMFKSTDGGKTWVHIGLAKTHVISWIVVDPSNPNVVYAASMGHIWAPNKNSGVYKTTDGGKSWKKVLYVNAGTGAITLAMDPKDPNVVYASMWQFIRHPWGFSSGGPSSGIYKTTDGGAHWSNITHAAGLPPGIFGKVGLAVAPSQPNVVYALIQAKLPKHPGKPGGLFRSSNGGRTWTLVNASSKLTQRAFYYMRVYVDPKDANTVYLPNVNVFVSHDAGKTLIKLKPPHGDNHAFWVNPSNPEILIEGNDGGATVSVDGGKTWSTEDNQPTGQFYHINLNHQFPFDIYAAQQDRSAVMGPSAVRFGKIPPEWKPAAGGESSWVVPQPGKPWITYGSGYFSLMNSVNTRTGVDRSIDPSPVYHVGAPASELTYRSNWSHHPIVFQSPNVLLNGMQYVLKSTDFGQSWTRIGPDLTRNDKSKQELPGGPISKDISGAEIYDTISAMAVSPTNPDVIWTGSDDGLVYVTTDDGTHWRQVRPHAMPKWIKITSVEPSYTSPGTAYITGSRYQWDDFEPYVYMTTDYGKHWTSLAHGLPSDQYLNAIRQDPDASNLLFVATSKTVFVSFNDGKQWSPLTLNLPPVRVSDLEIQAPQHAVVLATFGRGIWVLDDLQYLEQLGTANVAGTAPYLFEPQQTWLVKRSSFCFGCNGRPGGKNAPVGAAVYFYLPASYKSGMPVKLTFTTTDGKRIRSFNLPVVPKPNGTTNKVKKPKHLPKLHPGMNHFQWNLHYKPAIYPKGYFIAETGRIEAPSVVPGTYDAVLSYNGTTLKEPFVVKLDPRLTTTTQQLDARNALLLKINDTLNALSVAVNQATTARGRLQEAVAAGRVPAARASNTLAALNGDIGALVNFKIQSDEGDLVYETRVFIRLIQLAADVQQSYTPLKPQNVQGFATLSGKAQAGEKQLHVDVAAANALLRP